jgi:hypothetical protein
MEIRPDFNSSLKIKKKRNFSFDSGSDFGSDFGSRTKSKFVLKGVQFWF